jgi:hypothetical protein
MRNPAGWSILGLQARVRGNAGGVIDNGLKQQVKEASDETLPGWNCFGTKDEAYGRLLRELGE